MSYFRAVVCTQKFRGQSNKSERDCTVVQCVPLKRQCPHPLPLVGGGEWGRGRPTGAETRQSASLQPTSTRICGGAPATDLWIPSTYPSIPHPHPSWPAYQPGLDSRRTGGGIQRLGTGGSPRRNRRREQAHTSPCYYYPQPCVQHGPIPAPVRGAGPRPHSVQCNEQLPTLN